MVVSADTHGTLFTCMFFSVCVSLSLVKFNPRRNQEKSKLALLLLEIVFASIRYQECKINLRTLKNFSAGDFSNLLKKLKRWGSVRVSILGVNSQEPPSPSPPSSPPSSSELPP